jgi:uncharacterized protein YndB with AHSA1/START domain
MSSSSDRFIKLIVRKIIPASREEVFSAWTDPESIRHWMCPGEIIEAEAQLDVRVGGTYRILMKGKTVSHDHRGIYKVVEPPSRLVFTWVSRGTEEQETLVTVELFERAKGTELVLTHERFPSAASRDPHERGWGQIADKLVAHFSRRQEKRAPTQPTIPAR